MTSAIGQQRMLPGLSVRTLGVLWCACACSVAFAQTVAMSGSMGRKTLLTIDGLPPKALSAGESFKGVKVIDVQDEQTVVEVNGKRLQVRLGASPVSAGRTGGAANGRQIVLTAGSGGHFLTSGSINGRAVEFMVDTGATTVAMGMTDAKRLGIDYEKGVKGWGSTANGQVMVYHVKLNKVKIQDVEMYDVDASVLPAAMSHILLGNSFLSRFQMKRDNDQLTLTKRY